MKNKVLPQQVGGVSKSTVAKHYNVNGGSVTAWVKAGCPQLPNGQFVLSDVEAWLQKRQAGKEKRASLKDQKTQAEIDRIQRDIAKRDLELSRDKGEVHSKSDCAASLTALVNEHLHRPLMRLHTDMRTAFPELPQAVTDALRERVDAMVNKLRKELSGAVG